MKQHLKGEKQTSNGERMRVVYVAGRGPFVA